MTAGESAIKKQNESKCKANRKQLLKQNNPTVSIGLTQIKPDGFSRILAMAGDWIKLHRKALDSRVFSDDFLWRLWCWCLMKSNWKDGFYRGEKVQRGQFVTGRNAASEELGCSPSKWYRGMQKLEEFGQIKQQVNSKWTTVSICNFSTYQGEGPASRTADEQQVNSERTASEQQVNTIEEGKDIKEGKKSKKVRNQEETNVSVSRADGINAKDFFDRWNRFVADKPKLKKVIKLSDTRRKKINSRLKESEWWESFQAAVKLLPLLGDGWQPDFDWMVRNNENVYMLLEGKYEWRTEGAAARKLAEQRRRVAANEREQRIAKEKEQCRKDSQKNSEIMKDILHPTNGSDGETKGKSLLFG